MKKFLWIAFLSFCFSGVAAESDWNADSVQVYFSRSVTPVVQKNWKDHKLILKTYRQFLKTCESVPDSVLKQCSWCFIDTYYNVACCESLMKRKKRRSMPLRKLFNTVITIMPMPKRYRFG